MENQEKYKFREKISFDAMFVAAVNRKSAFQDAVPNLHFQGAGHGRPSSVRASWNFLTLAWYFWKALWALKFGTRLCEFLNFGIVILEIYDFACMTEGGQGVRRAPPQRKPVSMQGL